MASESALSRDQLRTCLLYDFKSGLNARQSTGRINEAFGAGTIGQSTAYVWFQRFQEGDCSTEDSPRSGRPSEIDDDQLRARIEADPQVTVRDLAEEFKVSKTTIDDHLKAMGKVSKLNYWVPHKLSDNNRQRRLDACISLLSKERTTDWLDTIVTGDEKWCLYANVVRKRSWVDKGTPAQAQPRPEIHQKKLMLCVWWDVSGVIYWEMLNPNQTINADLYCTQLQKLADAISQKRPNLKKIRFLHDNARPHTAKKTREKLLQLQWEVLIHPPYSPDLAPSDFYLFCSLQNFLKNKHFRSDDELKMAVDEFFRSKSTIFFRKGIHELPNRWQQVINSNGDYFVN